MWILKIIHIRGTYTDMFESVDKQGVKSRSEIEKMEQQVLLPKDMKQGFDVDIT